MCKNRKLCLSIFILLASIWIGIGSSCSAEEMTLTTYYPSPYGAYDELRAEKMGIGLGTLSPKSPLQIADNVANGALDNFSEYQILLYDESNAINSYGLGIRSGTLVFNTNDDFDFDRDGSTVMTIDSGNVGIGTTSPGSYRLNVQGGDVYIGEQLFLGGSPSYSIPRLYVNQQYSPGIGIYVNSVTTGIVSNIVGDLTGIKGYCNGIGTAIWGQSTNGVGVKGSSNNASSYDFYAVGAGINYGSTSSIRWKKNIRPIDSALEKALKLRGVYFDWDEDHGGHHDFGMIAEEVGKVFPEVVGYEDDSEYAIGMDYSRLTSVLVEAIKEQQKKIEDLEKRIESLEKIILNSH